MVVNLKLTPIFSMLLTLLNVFTTLVIGWACFHGFDLSDESYYYLGYLYYDNAPELSPASFHLILGRLFSSLDLTLTELRLLRLFLTIVASFILYFGVRKITAYSTKSEKLILFNIVLSGALMSYTWAPLALSYNSLSSILIGCIVGFWLLGLTKGRTYFRIIHWAILGSLFVLLFFIKITNVIMLPLLIAATIYLLYKKKTYKSIKRKFTLLDPIAFVGGILIMLVITSNGISSIPQIVSHHFQESLGLASNDSSHSIEHLWKRYYDNAEMVLQLLKYPLLLLIIFFLVVKVYLLKSKKEARFIPQILFKVIGLTILIVMVFQNQFWKGGTGYTYVIAITYFFVVAFTFLNRYIERKNVDILLLLGSLAIPISGAIGTNNGLSAQVLFYAVFIFLTIYYLVRSSKYLWYSYAVLTIVLLLGALQIISATVYRPYRQTVLTTADNRLEGVAVLENLEVDKAIFELRKELAFLENVDANYIFTYGGTGGMVLLANKKPYSLQWFVENSTQKMCGVVKESRIMPKDIIFLIPSDMPLEDKVVSCLESNGVFFKTDFFKVKEIKFYNQRHAKDMTLNVYLPSLSKKEL